MRSYANTINPLYLECVEWAKGFIKHTFPLGAINRKDVYDKNPEASQQQLFLINKMRHLIKKKNLEPEDIKLFEKYSSQLQGGACGEFVMHAIPVLQLRFPNLRIEGVNFTFHQSIVIGRKRGNPNDVKTWVDKDNEGIFLDLWTDEYYPISKLAEQKKKPPIPYYLFATGTNPNQLSLLILSKDHYLSGDPSIMPETNLHKDDKQPVSISKGVKTDPLPMTFASSTNALFFGFPNDEAIKRHAEVDIMKLKSPSF